jgi:2-polyprenyl-6-methoxyphenol hydroxylase-like FAD-dependent oxidoreductase
MPTYVGQQVLTKGEMTVNAPVTRAKDPIDADVLVVGAGPTGLTLAAALGSRGIRALVIDRLTDGANTSRAAVVHARTLEVLEELDVARRLVPRGIRSHRFTIRDRDRVLAPIGFGHLPTQYPYALMVPQAVTERVLHERLAETGASLRRGHGLTALEQDADGVTATLDDGSRLRARFVVGADGMHSKVRQILQIPFRGASYGESFVLADARLSGGVPTDEVILFFSPAGMVVVAPLPEGIHRIVATVDVAPEHPDVAWVQALLDARGPQRDPVSVHEVLWGSRFHVHHRIADSYVRGRVLLAGDAAHVHSPAGGQGMNAGILDAVALADALEQALAGDVAALDRYGKDRRPVARRIAVMADRLTRLATVRPALRSVRNSLLSMLMRLPPMRRRFAWQLSGLVYR